MFCRDCARYDADHAKCRDGKVNPERWDMAVNVAQVMGIRSICLLNDYRERLILCRSPQASERKQMKGKGR